MPAMESGWSGPTTVARVPIVALQARRVENFCFEQPDIRDARLDFARDAEFLFHFPLECGCIRILVVRQAGDVIKPVPRKIDVENDSGRRDKAIDGGYDVLGANSGSYHLAIKRGPVGYAKFTGENSDLRRLVHLIRGDVARVNLPRISPVVLDFFDGDGGGS